MGLQSPLYYFILCFTNYGMSCVFFFFSILNLGHFIRKIKWIHSKLWLVKYIVEHKKWDREFTFLRSSILINLWQIFLEKNTNLICMMHYTYKLKILLVSLLPWPPLEIPIWLFLDFLLLFLLLIIWPNWKHSLKLPVPMGPKKKKKTIHWIYFIFLFNPIPNEMIWHIIVKGTQIFFFCKG